MRWETLEGNRGCFMELEASPSKDAEVEMGTMAGLWDRVVRRP